MGFRHFLYSLLSYEIGKRKIINSEPWTMNLATWIITMSIKKPANKLSFPVKNCERCLGAFGTNTMYYH